MDGKPGRDSSREGKGDGLRDPILVWVLGARARAAVEKRRLLCANLGLGRKIFEESKI